MIGIIGGSGFYEFLGDDVKMPARQYTYGSPASNPAIGKIGDKKVAFLARHGKDHSWPPHLVNYRANLWALKQQGVKQVLATCAVGSLKEELQPGHFVIPDQIVDRTWGRIGTYQEHGGATFDRGNDIKHLSFAEPYDVDLRQALASACSDVGATYHIGGTVLVINGPRFSTKAESKFYQSQGWDLLNMTQAPEAQLAAELGMAYAALAVVTDYDFGLDVEGMEPVTHEQVLAQFSKSMDTVKDVITKAIEYA